MCVEREKSDREREGGREIGGSESEGGGEKETERERNPSVKPKNGSSCYSTLQFIIQSLLFYTIVALLGTKFCRKATLKLQSTLSL